MYDPWEKHLQVVNRILEYLEGSPRIAIQKRGYIVSGDICMFLGGNLERNKKQNIVARSSA